ncbi:MAG: DUF3800 domain-containing protein [Candidatus Pseudobacter hemicellulosilyticus]|uniref:DUF3800 domain-containing protein n=1 Tax=Candidatus Pseudobacter hemicellulosilyticus TaxID=3121375 RepID=A0AAJ5WLT6_9BACT|nr:MAG: DUF3800 domain-containing protein [Pseudobacter sp.]
MNLLYVDESGAVNDPKQQFFVLAGISFFERQCFWIGNELDKIAERYNPADPNSVELHGGPIFHGKGFWRRFRREERLPAITDALSVLTKSHKSNRIFACIVQKSQVSPKDAVTLAFEQLASRFDYFLSRLYKQGDKQRGLIIFDKSTYETTIQNLATDFRTIGHTWGVLKNLSEVPLFIDSRASRLIQLADLVAYSIFRRYEHQDDQFFSIIKDRFDEDGGIVHGLCERVTDNKLEKQLSNSKLEGLKFLETAKLLFQKQTQN